MAELVSTRDSEAIPASYGEAVLHGLAPDGGLYTMPIGEYPTFAHNELLALSGASYQTIYGAVREKLVGLDEIPAEVQESMAGRAYAAEAFPAAPEGNPAPVEELADNLYLLDLSRGPTAAFKDFGLRSLREDVDYMLEGSNGHLTILGATSGDTASAAESAFKSSHNATIFMLSPEDGMSDFQRAQMAELSGDNVHNISIPERFDVCQEIVKTIMRDPEFADLSAVNSINWGRIVAQTVYYFSGYLQMVGKDIGKPVDVVVPTGNFGDILSAHVAKQMGLPLGKLVAATNENDVMHRIIETGKYEPQPAQVTSSPSMDIARASNYERLVYEIFEGDTSAVREYMSQIDQAKPVNLQDFGRNVRRAFGSKGRHFRSGSAGHFARRASIKWAYENAQRVIDPHTAAAVAVARKRPNIENVMTMCVETASPVKFEETIEEALGFVPQRDARFENLEERVDVPGGFVPLTSIRGIMQYIRDHRQPA